MIDAELQVLGTLPLLAGFADDLDGPTGKGANDALWLILGGRSSDLDERFDLFLLLVNIRDEELFANTTADVCRTGRGVVHVERLARRSRPVDRAILRGGFAGDGDDNARRGESGLFSSAQHISPPRVTDHDCGGRGTQEPLLCAVRFLSYFGRHDDDGPFTKSKPVRRANVLVEVRSNEGL
jgi:hypothetical protein